MKKIKINKLLSIFAASTMVVFSASQKAEAQTYPISPAIEVSSSRWTPYIMIGKNDIPSNALMRYNHVLSFGPGHPDTNYGLWFISSNEKGLVFSRVWNTIPSNTGWSRSIFIDSTGCVGINHWYPDASNNCKLDVNGNIRAWNVAIQSDRRYKRNIKPISNLDNLFKINSVQYQSSGEVIKEKLELFKQKYKDLDEQNFNLVVADFENQIAERNADTRIRFGFLAQELHEVYPNLVFEDSEGFLSVDYIGMIPVLLEAIKEQQKQIDELKGKDFEKTINTQVVSTAKLYQNEPNPFSENTEIKYYIPENASSAMICIYDLVGSQIMRFDLRDKGYSSLTVRGRELKAGMYIYALLVDGKEIDTKRMILTD